MMPLISNRGPVFCIRGMGRKTDGSLGFMDATSKPCWPSKKQQPDAIKLIFPIMGYSPFPIAYHSQLKVKRTRVSRCSAAKRRPEFFEGQDTKSNLIEICMRTLGLRQFSGIAVCQSFNLTAALLHDR